MLSMPKCVTHSRRADSWGMSLSDTMRSVRLEQRQQLLELSSVRCLQSWKVAHW